MRATDTAGSGLSSDTDVIVHVMDVNDVTPRFSKAARMLRVSSQIEVGQVIGTLGAEDEDATAPNNVLIYSLENDPYGKFAVDSHTGTPGGEGGEFRSGSDLHN